VADPKGAKSMKVGSSSSRRQVRTDSRLDGEENPSGTLRREKSTAGEQDFSLKEFGRTGPTMPEKPRSPQKARKKGEQP